MIIRSVSCFFIFPSISLFLYVQNFCELVILPSNNIIQISISSLITLSHTITIIIKFQTINQPFQTSLEFLFKRGKTEVTPSIVKIDRNYKSTLSVSCSCMLSNLSFSRLKYLYKSATIMQ